MATPITQMPKPDAGQYSGERKLFLVPSFMLPPTLPEEGLALLDAYWSEVRDHVASLLYEAQCWSVNGSLRLRHNGDRTLLLEANLLYF